MKINIFNYTVDSPSGDGELTVYIDGAIVDAETQQIMRDWFGDDTSVSFKSFRDTVNTYNPKKLNVIINSPGGHVGDAMAIHDMIVEMQQKGIEVNTKGRGIIASAATYILMAGNSEMSANSWLMIHNVSGGVMGDVDTVESYARSLRKFNDATRDFYADYTGIDKEEIEKMMNAETWMTADEAKDKGFVKNITGKVKFSQSISADNWAYGNKAVLNIYNQSVITKMENFKFQNTLKVANAEAFDVVDGGFLLTEDHLNTIENRVVEVTNLETELANLRGERDSLTNTVAEKDGAMAIANARIQELEAEVERLNASTPPPSGTSKEDDPFNDDSKPVSEVTAEANRIRIAMGKPAIQ